MWKNLKIKRGEKINRKIKKKGKTQEHKFEGKKCRQRDDRMKREKSYKPDDMKRCRQGRTRSR